MHNHGHRGSGSRPRAGAWLTPQEHAAALKLAIEWRQEWRDQVAGRDESNGRSSKEVAKRPAAQRSKSNDRAAFAAGIARAELGRFYWDAKKHRLAGKGRKPQSPK